MRVTIDYPGTNYDTYRYNRAVSLYNVDYGPSFKAEYEVPVEGDWQIGLVVGPSGSGKSSIARALVAEGWTEADGAPWPESQCVIDAINPDADFDRVTAALASVGLGDVPAWLRPHGVLSNGEKFRADLARVLATAEPDDRVLFDEFTSVVDRQVATIGAAAFAKAWRRTGAKVVLLTCHYDVAEYVEPDWVVDTGDKQTWIESDRYREVGRVEVPGGKGKKYARVE